jgi:hypothetical protein
VLEISKALPSNHLKKTLIEISTGTWMSSSLFWDLAKKKRNVIESSLVFQTPLQPGIVRNYQGSEKPYLLDSNGYTDSRHSGTRCTETEPEKSGNTG